MSGMLTGLPTPESQLESLQRLLAETSTRLAAVERERDGLRTQLEGFWMEYHREQDVRRLVEAARAYLEKQTAARQLELAAALKPFEEM